MSRLAAQVDTSIFVDYETEGTPEDFKIFIEGFLEFMTKRVIERIEEVIRKQLFNWDPLSDSWKNFKERMGLDPRIWVASGQTKDAVTYWYNNLYGGYLVGVHPRTLHRKYKKGGLSSEKTKARLIDIIRWNEHGTQHSPARPLFIPVIEEFRKRGKQQKLYREYLNMQKGVA